MQQYKILVIDDEPEILKTYLTVLSSSQDKRDAQTLDHLANDLFTEKSKSQNIQEPHFFNVTCASQGKEGIEAIAVAHQVGDPFAVAFIDMRMPPGLDGLETAKSIINVDPNVEIIIVTAYSDRKRQEIVDTLGQGRFFYLKKPFHPDELFQMAHSLSIRWEMARERERLDQEKEIFASNMSHELRHPLHVILGICDTLLKCEMTNEQRQQFTQDIEQEARRLSSLAENLKTLNHLDEQIFINNFTEVNLIKMVDYVGRLLSEEVEKKGLTMIRDGDNDLPLALGDENSLTQVFINLLINAIHYTNEGEIRVTLLKENQQIKVIVKDTGVGISSSDQKLIFQNFYRVKQQALKIRGHGLGLSIVKNILDAHGSDIYLNSELGKGTQFWFSLPIQGLG